MSCRGEYKTRRTIKGGVGRRLEDEVGCCSGKSNELNFNQQKVEHDHVVAEFQRTLSNFFHSIEHQG